MVLTGLLLLVLRDCITLRKTKDLLTKNNLPFPFKFREVGRSECIGRGTVFNQCVLSRGQKEEGTGRDRQGKGCER